jgi:agmatinase
MNLVHRLSTIVNSKPIFESLSTIEKSKFVIVPVPFDGTSSYRLGSAFAPDAVIEATHQVDTFDLEFSDNVVGNIFVDDPVIEAVEANEIARDLYRRSLNNDTRALDELNRVCNTVYSAIRDRSRYWLSKGKVPIVLGGDNSVSLGSIVSHFERFKDLSVLHFDAHADLRTRYNGCHFSHAAVMSNVVQMTKCPITQVGVRDLSEFEYLSIMNSRGRITPFFAKDLWEYSQYESFDIVAERIATTLSPNVYVCFDMDVFDISMVPNTGTPVPGGLNWWQVNAILKAVVNAGRKIVGFDINESSPDGNDPIIAARMLHKLCGWSGAGPRASLV